jgi:hypothetical protein
MVQQVKRYRYIFVLTLTLMMGFSFVADASATSLSIEGKKAQETYKKNRYTYSSKLATYTPQGDYFHSSDNIYQTSRLTKDQYGIVMVKYGSSYQYNPVTIAQIALTNYGKYVNTKNLSNKNVFIKYADALVRMQGKDGALRYNFEYSKSYLHANYKAGWVSSMAQGQALSVYSRAYYLTKDVKYLNAGKMAFQFANTPESRGGTLTTLASLGKQYKDYFFYEEYITSPGNYTLNGYMFTLIGLYDWSKVISDTDYGQKEAARMFKNGISSLTVVLPMYDVGGFSSYDLSGKTMKQSAHVVENYHAVHIYQLYGLYTITKNPILLKYHKLWATYVK